MKKFTLTAALLLASSIANANWYVQGEIGASNLSIDEVSSSDTVFNQRISVGYAFNQYPIRVALDYTNFGNAKFEDGIDFTLKTRSIGLSASYNFKNISNWTPYVGLRISHNHFKLDASYTVYNTTYYGQGSETRVGIGGFAGLDYKLTENLSANIAIESNRLAGDVLQYGVKTGLRYSF